MIDPHSYKATEAVAKKAQKGFNGIQTHDLRNTTAMRSTKWAMKPHWKQDQSKFNLNLLYKESEMRCIWYKSYECTADKEFNIMQTIENRNKIKCQKPNKVQTALLSLQYCIVWYPEQLRLNLQ